MPRPPIDIPLDLNSLLARATAAFKSRFGRAAKYAAAAPGRVNLIGDHTDYNHGFVLPIAIDRYTVVVGDLAGRPGAPRKQSTLWLIDVDETLDIDLTLPLTPLPGKAANYLLGVVQQFIDRDIPVPNFDVVVTSSVPIGAGLASSAALEVAFATFLEQVTGIELDKKEKALLCQRAEHKFPGTPCGIMDMYTAIFARAGHALLLDCRTHESESIPIGTSDDAGILIIDAGVKHELAEGRGGEYAERRAACDRIARKLGVAAIRDATPEMIEMRQDILSEDERAKAMHVIGENARTMQAADALRVGNLLRVGELMFESHASLRDLFEVSCPELDVLVDAARRLRSEGPRPQVFGARMTGAGFGGCVVAVCTREGVMRVQSELADAFAAAFGRSCAMFCVNAVDGAKAMEVGEKR
ncbi:MAG: galactokinase [Phycisphaerales bacterium]|nr:galactokinase [Phycisphaerales bacterium]